MTNTYGSDFARLDATADEAIDCTDSPETDEAFWSEGVEVWRGEPEQKRLTIDLEAEVFDWLQAQNAQDPRHLNRLLKALMRSHPLPALPKS